MDNKPTEHAEISTMDYRFLLMGYAIGIGNVWRFPYLVGKFGGGAFLVAYAVSLILVACPMYFLELSWGNYTRKSTMDCMKVMHPRWVGVGWMTAFMLIMVLSYYNMLLAYSLVYLFHSFSDPLPWTVDSKAPNMLPAKTSASENFWWNEVLVRYDPGELTRGEIDGPGALQWHLVFSLGLVWLIVFGALCKGITASAKVSYVTVGLPIILMLVLLFRSVTLDGANDGVEFYIGKFKSDKLGDLEMWATACGQILFSLSPGMGTAITISSCTKRTEDVYATNMFVACCNSCFSVVGGFAVFSILGYMSKKSCNTPGLVCQSVEELADSGGAGLAFVVLAEGVGLFGVTSNFFATLFFIMLLTLGLDSTFAWAETVITYADDYLIHIGRPQKKWVIVGGVCLFFFLFGLPYCTRVGFPLLDIVDHYVASYCLIIACFFEAIILRVDWGWDRVVQSIKRATIDDPQFNGRGRELSQYWYYTLYYTVGPICFGMFLFLFITDLTRSYEDYPPGLQAYGWVLLGISFLFIPVAFFMYSKESPPSFEEEHEEPLLPQESVHLGKAAGMAPEQSAVVHRGNPHPPHPAPPVEEPAEYVPPTLEQRQQEKTRDLRNSSDPFPAPPPVAEFPTPPVSNLVPGYTVDTHDPLCPLGSMRKDNPLSHVNIVNEDVLD